MTNMTPDVETFLILKYGSLRKAYNLWMHDFEDTPFTQEESDSIAEWAKANNLSRGAYTYDYQV